MKINLRESLNKIDLATDNKYDLLNTFDSKKLSDNSKKKLAEAIENNSIDSINRVLHESEEKVFTVKVYQDYPFVAEVIDNSIVDKNGEGKVLKKFTNRDDLDTFANELISKGYVNYQGYSKNKSLHESEEQLYKVVIQSGATKRDFESALYEDEAEEIVDYYGGRWIDENGFEWNMYVEEDDDSTEHTMIDNSYDMEDDDERAQREMAAYDQTDRDWEYIESLTEAIKDINSLHSKIWNMDNSEKICFPNGYCVKCEFYDREGKAKRYIVTDKEDNVIIKGKFGFAWQPQIKKFEEDFFNLLNGRSVDESLNEADYGGAYDIENDMFFTKEDIVEFAEEVCEYLGDIFGYQYDINNVYMDGPRKLYINIYDNNYIEVESTFDIDMRKIRKPSDLSKAYGLTIENWFQKAFAREYRDAGLDESLVENRKVGSNKISAGMGLPGKDWELVKIIDGIVSSKDKYECRIYSKELDTNYKKYGFYQGEVVFSEDYDPQLIDSVFPDEGTKVKLAIYKVPEEDPDHDWTGDYFVDYIDEINESLKEDTIKQNKRSEKKFNSRKNAEEFMKKLPKEAEAEMDYFDHENEDGSVSEWYEVYYWENPLIEDTVKTKSGKWVNKGDTGKAHGEFKTKKAADQQRKAMFANGYKGESLNESSEPTEEDWNDFYKLEEDFANIMHSLNSDLDDAQANFYHDDFDGSIKITYRFVGAVENKNSKKTLNKIEKALESYLEKSKFSQYIEIDIYPMDSEILPPGIKNYEIMIKAETEPTKDPWKNESLKSCDTLEYDDKAKDKFGKLFDVADPQEVANTMKKYVKHNGKTYKPESLKEAIDDEIDLDYETDFDEDRVEEGNTFIEDGTEWCWIERIAGPVHLDFDNWSVWSARNWDQVQDAWHNIDIETRKEAINSRDTDFFIEVINSVYDQAEVAYFVVEEDTGFIDWGPVETQTEAQDFLNGKVEDYENDEEYEEVEVEEESLKESINQNDVFKFLDEIKDTVSSFKNRVQEVSEYFNISEDEAEDFVYDWEQEESLTESRAIKNNGDYEVILHYDDIGDGKEYDYTLGYDEVIDYLKELAWSNGDDPEDASEDEYLEWVMDNFDELADKYELNVLDYFEDEASQYEYDHRNDEP